MNKLSTKVEIRFVVEEAEWLPHDVRVRLARHQSGRINSRGELVITSQEFRCPGQAFLSVKWTTHRWMRLCENAENRRYRILKQKRPAL